MTLANSNLKSAKRKPNKPHKDYPLFAHASGQWAKKVRGKLYYFGTWDDSHAALEKWIEQKDALLAGRTPEVHSGSELTVEYLCNHFLESKEADYESGELSAHAFTDYLAYCRRLTEFFGRTKLVEQLRPTDFARFRAELAKPRPHKNKQGKVVRKAKKSLSLKGLETQIAYCRAVFNYAEKNYLIEVPLRKLWGTSFDKPKSTAIEKERNSNGARRFVESSEIHTLLEHATPVMRAFILLAINAGIGNTDAARIEFKHCDLKNGVLELPRSKTGKTRKCFLWPETVAAIECVVSKRPVPKDNADSSHIFLTQAGGNWIPRPKDNAITKEFTKLKLKADLIRAGLSFYSLRHTFQSVADETRDFVAVSYIMGHAKRSISDTYRHQISDDRLRAVTDHVRKWLFESK